jgi:ribosomal protein S12 methylthiotransferase accessory factor
MEGESMELKVTLGSGKKVATRIGNHVITTDQPAKYGGEDTAPAPFDLFVASIATCAGFFVKSYCDKKGIDTSGIEISMTPVVDEKTKQVGGFITRLHLPESLPQELHAPLRRAAEQCTVKKTIKNQPTFVVETVSTEG